MKKKKKAQIWVETVIYTLIALAIIGAVLAFVRPKIQEIQDQTVIEQSLEMMEYIDQIVSQVNRGGGGNTRTAEVGIKKGELSFDGAADTIVFTIEDTEAVYSEPGTVIQNGPVKILTTEANGVSTITLTLDYSDRYNLKFDGTDSSKSITKAPTDYSIRFGNLGNDWKRVGSGTVDSSNEDSMEIAGGLGTLGLEEFSGSPVGKYMVGFTSGELTNTTHNQNQYLVSFAGEEKSSSITLSDYFDAHSPEPGDTFTAYICNEIPCKDQIKLNVELL